MSDHIMVQRVADALEKVQREAGPYAGVAYTDLARAAIEAMMEPSEEMIEAGCDGRKPGNSRWGNSMGTWKAMIRVALEGK